MQENNNSQPLMVSIKCITYNHEPYIRQCLEGFVMQKTNFRFEAVVHDDASTDGTADIIREYAEKYPDIIKPIYETENQYSKKDGSLGRIMDAACTGKYIAMCEGDDYWTDPSKLQKQVDILESNPEVGLVHTDFDLVKGIRRHFKRSSKPEKCLPLLLKGGYSIGTLTVMYRLSSYNKLSKDWNKIEPRLPMGDSPLWIELAAISKFVYISDCTARYRVLPNSASHSDINKEIHFRNEAVRCGNYYAEKWGLEGVDERGYYVSVMRIALKFKDRRIANKYIKKALRKRKLSLMLIVFYILIIIVSMFRKNA